MQTRRVDGSPHRRDWRKPKSPSFYRREKPFWEIFSGRKLFGDPNERGHPVVISVVRPIGCRRTTTFRNCEISIVLRHTLLPSVVIWQKPIHSGSRTKGSTLSLTGGCWGSLWLLLCKISGQAGSHRDVKTRGRRHLGGRPPHHDGSKHRRPALGIGQGHTTCHLR